MVALQCYFLLYGKVNQPYVYAYIPSFLISFPFRSHRTLSRIPCAVYSVPITYLFYTQYQ